jgi:hypothetical protein
VSKHKFLLINANSHSTTPSLPSLAPLKLPY